MHPTLLRCRSVCSSLVLACSLGFSTVGSAQNLTLYDGFDYGVTGAGSGVLAGQRGGFGWGTPWLGSGLEGLASWWPLDGTARDAGPFDSDGVMQNGDYVFETPPLVWSTHSLSLDSSKRGFVDLSPHAAKYNPMMRGTITLWQRSTKRGPLMVMVGGACDATGRSVQIFVQNGFLKYDVNGDLPSLDPLTGGTDISDGEWHHIAVAVDETGMARVYVDGNFETSGHQGFFGYVYNMDRLWIGRIELVTPSRSFDGQLDDVAIWGSVLTQAEVQLLASMPPPMVTVPVPPLGPTLKSESMPTAAAPSGAYGTFGFGKEGNRMSDTTGFPAYRRIKNEINLDGNETHYLSCLMQITAPGTDPAYEIQLTDRTASHIRVGWDSSLSWLVGYDSYTPGPVAQLNQTYFVVVKVKPVNVGNDTISLKVYGPGETVHASESMLIGAGVLPNNWTVIHASEALINTVDAVGLVPLGSGAMVDVDELRIGWSWESVTSLGYGAGCLGSKIGKSNRLAIGSNDFRVELNGASPNQAGFLAIGGSRTLWGTLPLPFDLTPLRAPGCRVLASFDVTLPVAINASGAAGVTLTVPNDPTLVGKFLFMQWASIDASRTNPLSLAFSNGLEAPFEQ